MLLGRPINLWTGLVTAIAGLVTSILVVAGFDPAVIAAIVGPSVTVLGLLIALIANQPPAVAQGGQINVTTPAGQPNVLATVNSPNTITPVP